MTNKKLKLAIFISGRGSNMEALMKACEQADFPAQIALVLSNNPEASGLQTAQSRNIPTEIVDHKNYDTRRTFEASMVEVLDRYEFDAICLAGFMRLLSAEFTEKFGGRMINIHPSLLPAYKGLHTHERALADGVEKAGCTVHYVTADMDSGETIVQREVPVEKNDTADTLAARVLEQEHIAYPQAVKILAKTLLNS